MAQDKPPVATGAVSRLGRYTLVKELAGSGVGSTWIARTGDELGEGGKPRLYSILRLHRHVTKRVEVAEAILEEARHAQKLRHANVTQVVETGVSDGEVFVVSDYTEGETFAGLCSSAGPEGLPLDVVLRIGLDILEALSAAHGLPEPLVHGELTPFSVVVTPEGLVKVQGFGIARALAKAGTHGIKNHDRLAYAAPERVKAMATSSGPAAPLDVRSDLFSVAVMLWEAVARQRLFASKMEAAVIQKVLTAPVPSLAEVAATKPPAEVQEAIARALDRDPAKRFANAGDFVVALEEAGPEKIALPAKIAQLVTKLSGKQIATRRNDLEAALVGGGGAGRGPDAPRPRAPTLLGMAAHPFAGPAPAAAPIEVSTGVAKAPPIALPTGHALEAIDDAPPSTEVPIEIEDVTVVSEPAPAVRVPASPPAPPVAAAAAASPPAPPVAIATSRVVGVGEPTALAAAPEPKRPNAPAPKRPRVATLLGFVPPTESEEVSAVREPEASAGDDDPTGVVMPIIDKPATTNGAGAAMPLSATISVAPPAAPPPPPAAAKPEPKPAPPARPEPPKPTEKSEAKSPEPGRVKTPLFATKAAVQAKPEAPAATARLASPTKQQPAVSRNVAAKPVEKKVGEFPSPEKLEPLSPSPIGSGKGRGKAAEAIERLGPGTALGRYELLMPIAKGGMAAVWAARLPGTRGFSKIVAVKTMLPDVSDDPDFEKMFLDEARVAARIRHPNVVEILDLGEQHEVLYLVMEWVEGETIGNLQKAAKSHGGMPVPIVLRIASQICAGLHAAHELRDDGGHLLEVVHRDISPANVLVSTQGFVKIVDFGIAKSKGRLHVTRAGDQVKGKTPYLSPEQLGGQSVDRRSDLFSLGVLLYVLTTGLHPFRGDTELKTVQNIALRNPPGLREILPTVDAEFEKIVFKALEKEPSKRFASAMEMQRAIDQVASTLGTPVTDEDVAAFVRKVIGDAHEQRAAELRTAMANLDAAGEAPTLIVTKATADGKLAAPPAPPPPTTADGTTKPDAPRKTGAAGNGAPAKAGADDLAAAAPAAIEEELSSSDLVSEDSSDKAALDLGAAADRGEGALEPAAFDSIGPPPGVDELAQARRKRVAMMAIVGALGGCVILGAMALLRSGSGGTTTGGPEAATTTATTAAVAATQAPATTAAPAVDTQTARVAEPTPPPPETTKPAEPEPPVAPTPPPVATSKSTAAAKPPSKPAAPAKPPTKPAAPPAKPSSTTKKYNPKGI